MKTPPWQFWSISEINKVWLPLILLCFVGCILTCPGFPLIIPHQGRYLLLSSWANLWSYEETTVSIVSVRVVVGLCIQFMWSNHLFIWQHWGFIFVWECAHSIKEFVYPNISLSEEESKSKNSQRSGDIGWSVSYLLRSVDVSSPSWWLHIQM